MAARRRLLELDQKIEVAARGIEPARRGRAEQIEPAHAEPAAQRPQRRQVRFDDFGTTACACWIVAHAGDSNTRQDRRRYASGRRAPRLYCDVRNITKIV